MTYSSTVTARGAGAAFRRRTDDVSTSIMGHCLAMLTPHVMSACAEKKEFSILLIAGGAAVAAALGGLLLDDGVEDVEKAVQTGNIPGLNLAAAPVDESTKLALKVAVGLLVVVGVTAGAHPCWIISTALSRRQCGCCEGQVQAVAPVGYITKLALKVALASLAMEPDEAKPCPASSIAERQPRLMAATICRGPACEVQMPT